MRKTAKRFLVLLGMLASMMATAVPALAESEPMLTGVLEGVACPAGEGVPCPDQEFGYGLTDEASGTFYGVLSDEDLSAYEGRRVNVFFDGTVAASDPPLVRATRIEPADDPIVGPPVGPPPFVCAQGYQYGPGVPVCPPPGEETVTVTFELTIEGEVPEGKVLGVDTGIQDIAHPVFCSTTTYDSGLPRCEDGATYSDTLEWPAGSLSYEYTVFDQYYGGVVETFSADTQTFTEDATVSATYDVPNGPQPPAPPTVEEGSATGVVERLGEEDVFCGASTHFVVDEQTGRQVDLVSDVVDLDAYVGQLVTAYGELLASPAVVEAERCPDLDVTRVEPADVDPVDPAPSKPAPVEPVGPGVDVDGDGSVDASDGEEAARVSDSAKTNGGTRVLPSTGGAALALLGAGALLTVAGLLARRATR